MIKKELIEIILTTNARKYYESLGYNLPEKSKCIIKVWSTDLPQSSKFKITRVCDSCGEEHIMGRSKYVPICRRCNSGRMSKGRKDESLTTCIDCGYDRQIALKAHHLYAYEAHKDLALDIENGVALCSNCHEEFHKQYGWGENTPEQYIKFKEAYNG